MGKSFFIAFHSSSYVLDAYLRHPTDQSTFLPPCPIPREYFLPLKTTHIATPSISADHGTGATESGTTTASTQASNLKGESNARVAVSCPSPAPPRPIRILEIGAGTGYVGIALAKRLHPNCTLILTDLEEVVPLMQKNVLQHLSNNNSNNHEHTDESILDPSITSASPPPPPSSSLSAAEETSTETTKGQCARVLVEPLAWGNSDHAAKILAAGRIEYIIASDLVYFPELYPPLLTTLREITVAGETKILFGYKERAPWKESPFWEEFGRYFEIEVVRIQQHKKKDLNKGQDQDQEDEDLVSVFGCEGEDRMYVFVCTKRHDEDILQGIDDTLATLAMMQMGY